MICPDEMRVAAFVEQTLSDADREALELHVYECDACREALAATVAVSGDARTIGRYRLDRLIGSGGMGVVWEAWDPALQRRVAIKLLRPDIASGRERMVREARALAALQHPNVVAVFDVGEADGDVFIATELVDGDPMAHWQLGRSARDIIAVYAQVARGLLAAHRAGLVHRDVKPSNILISRDGRARIGDFGLATRDRVAGAATEATDERITHDGQIVGTPAYMAPEQRAGRVVDERADQYSLCLALAEALTGTRPTSVTELPTEPPWPAIARGLAIDPDQRFATLEPLVIALEGRAPRSRGGYVIAAAGLVVGVAGALAFGLGHTKHADCTTRQPLADAMNHAAIRDAFHATKLAYADDAALITTGALDAYAATFIAEDRRVCEADDAKRRACLARIHDKVAHLVSALSTHPDPRAVQRAPASARELPDPVMCASAPEQVIPADPARAALMQRLSLQLEDAATLRRLGDAKAARARAEAALAEAVAANLVPAIAESRHELGTILHAQGDPAAEKVLVDGLAAAAAAHADLEAAQIAALLVEVVGEKGDVAAAERQAALARTAVIRAGTDRYLDAVIERGLGYANQEANKREAALQHYKRAEALHRTLGSLDDVNFDLRAQVTALGSLDRLDEAAKINAEVLAFDRANLGPMHPKTIADIAAHGELQFRAGHLAEAAKALETAVELDAKVSGADSAHAASLRGQLGGVYMTMGRIAESEPVFRDTVRVLAQHVPADDMELRGQRMNLAGVLILLGHNRDAITELDLLVLAARTAHDDDLLGLTLETLAEGLIGDGQYDRAIAACKEALALAATVFGPSSRRGAQAHTTLGNALAHAGKPAAAAAEFELAIQMYETSVDKSSQELGEALTGLAEIALARGDAKRARELLERAVKLRMDSDPVDLAASRYALGRTLHALHDPAAVTEVAAAIELWRRAGARADARRAAAEAWRRAHN